MVFFKVTRWRRLEKSEFEKDVFIMLLSRTNFAQVFSISSNCTKLSASLAFSFLLHFLVYSSFLLAHLFICFLSFINRKKE